MIRMPMSTGERLSRNAISSIIPMTFVAAMLASMLSAGEVLATDHEGQRPNIVIITADDMGYSDIGAYGSEIETPNLDQLAGNATLFTRFYTAPTCSPTRAMLLSGVDNHLAGLGNMEETMDPGQVGQPGYEGYLNDDVANMAEIFSLNGYQTYMTGKWHLGLEHDQSPYARGFQRTFALLGGGASHFSDRIGQDVFRTVAYYRRNGELVNELPEDFYSSDYFADEIIRFIREGDEDRPFLAYLNFTAPHWPLQAPRKDIEAQKGNYAVGYDVIRERRFKAMKDAGLISRKATMPPSSAPPWNTLTEDEKARSQRVMEVYAAMVKNMDSNIGKVIQELENSGRLENTIIIFMSDNGADGLEFSAIGAAFAEWTNSFDNRLENIGHKGSFVAYGRGWAHTGEAAHLGFKGLMTEGGIRTPLILFAPMAADDAGNAQVARYTHPITVRDILPTLMDFAGISNHGETFAGRDVHPITGLSIRQALTQSDFEVHAGKAISKELWNRRSVIMGDWKLVMDPSPRSDGEWKLYNLADDLAESNDLSSQHPEILKILLASYETYAKENNIIEPTAPFRLVEPENPKLDK